MSMLSAWEVYRSRRHLPHYKPMHQRGCPKGGSGVPMNEETCDCYELHLFMVGYLAANGLTPHFPNRPEELK